MNRVIIMKDRRLIEALDYIDDEYIASAALYKMRAEAERARPLAQTAGQSIKKHWKHYLGLVACLLVLALATPLFTHLPEIINSFAAGWGEGSSQLVETTELPDITTDLGSERTRGDFSETIESNTYSVYTEPESNTGYLIFTTELEKIEAETMLNIKIAWAQRLYDAYYPDYYFSHIRSGYSDEDAEAMAIKDATKIYETSFNHFFDTVNFYFYGYLGTIHDYVVLASYSNTTKPLKGLTIGGVDFGTQAIFFIYSNEKIIPLEEAYDENLVSYDELLLIKDRNCQYIDVKLDYYSNQFKEVQ